MLKSAILLLGALSTTAYAVDFPTTPAKHAQWDQSMVTENLCRHDGETDLVFWLANGARVTESRGLTICTYRCSRGHEWVKEQPKPASGGETAPDFNR